MGSWERSGEASQKGNTKRKVGAYGPTTDLDSEADEGQLGNIDLKGKLLVPERGHALARLDGRLLVRIVDWNPAHLEHDKRVDDARPRQVLRADDLDSEVRHGGAAHWRAGEDVRVEVNLLAPQKQRFEDISAAPVLAEEAVVDLHRHTVSLVVQCNHLAAHVPHVLRAVVARVDAGPSRKHAAVLPLRHLHQRLRLDAVQRDLLRGERGQRLCMNLRNRGDRSSHERILTSSRRFSPKLVIVQHLFRRRALS